MSTPVGLAERIVVIIGGTDGIGLGIARGCLDAGARVIIAGHDEGKAQAKARELGEGAEGSAIDVLQEESIKDFFEKLQSLDHLVVTAAPGSTGRFLEQNVSDARSYMDGKFWSSYLCARYAAAKMPQDGSITFLSGGMNRRPQPGSSVVAASQAATEALARALAVELAPLRVNTILPGTIDSSLWNSLADEERQKLFDEAAKVPAGRVGQPDDIARAALFLMTNTFVTGSTLEINGGALLI